MWSGLTKNSKMQSDNPNDLNAAGDDPFTETTDSWIVTLQPRGTGLAPESVLTDTPMDLGTMDVDTSTPVQGQPHRFGPRVVPDRNCLVLICQPAAGLTTIAQLQSEVYSLKFAPSVPPTPTRGSSRLNPGQPRLRLRKYLSSVDRPVGTNTGRSLML